MKVKSFTKKDLLKRLHKLGYTDIKERRITDWIAKSLLPPFDEKGIGCGRGKGRKRSVWKNGRIVLEQTVFVYKLLKIHRSADEIYIPLWLLGFEVPTDIVREYLLGGLIATEEMMTEEAERKIISADGFDRTDGIVEDFFTDIVGDLSGEANLRDLFNIPPELNEDFLNVFLNRDFKIDSFFKDDGMTLIEEMKSNVNENILPALSENLAGGDDNSNGKFELSKLSTFEGFINNAPMLQKLFSVPNLIKYVEKIDDRELEQVKTDMIIIRQIVESLGSGLSPLLEKLEIHPDEEDNLNLLESLITGGKLLILADISLRCNGYSELINQKRMEALVKIQQVINIDLSQEINKIDNVDVSSHKKFLKQLQRNFEKLIKIKYPQIGET